MDDFNQKERGALPYIQTIPHISPTNRYGRRFEAVQKEATTTMHFSESALQTLLLFFMPHCLDP
jgi:hypothetical protein